MHPRRRQGFRHRSGLAGWLIAFAPLPAFASDPATFAWGAYLFFAIVATLVIVLLLYEALEEEPTDDRHRDERLRPGRAQGRRGAQDQRLPRTDASRERAIAFHVPRR